jgi:polyribonucleotide nucleotidyltransferase
VGDGKRVEKVEDFLNVGDKLEVEISEIDSRGKIYLDKVRAEPAAAVESERPAGRDRGDRGPRDRGDRSGGEGGGEQRRRRVRER